MQSFERIGWYCVVLMDKEPTGYVLDRDYQLLVTIHNVTKALSDQVKRDCILHETQENYEIHTTPEAFKGKPCTAFWMY